MNLVRFTSATTSSPISSLRFDSVALLVLPEEDAAPGRGWCCKELRLGVSAASSEACRKPPSDLRAVNPGIAFDNSPLCSAVEPATGKPLLRGVFIVMVGGEGNGDRKAVEPALTAGTPPCGESVGVGMKIDNVWPSRSCGSASVQQHTPFARANRADDVPTGSVPYNLSLGTCAAFNVDSGSPARGRRQEQVVMVVVIERRLSFCYSHRDMAMRASLFWA